MSDTERAEIGRAHRTQPAGVPIYVDPEVTPPPIEPPPPEVFERMPPIDQLKSLHRAMETHTPALVAAYESRNDGRRIDRLELEVKDTARSASRVEVTLAEFVRPAIVGMMARLDVLLGDHERNKGRDEAFRDVEWPRTSKQVDALEDRIAAISRSQERQEIEWKTITAGLSGEIGALRLDVRAHHGRIEMIELRHRDATVGDARQAKIFSWAKVALLGIATLVGAVVSHIGTIVAFFQK